MTGFHDPDSPVTDATGAPLWRVAPTPHGRYWDEGMKVGYQDAGSWTPAVGPSRRMSPGQTGLWRGYGRSLPYPRQSP